jgi:type II secretory pathway pseudopilin PulG
MGSSQAGYAMAALLVMLNIMAILMTVAMPVWKTAVKREKEAELIWRATQYVRAVDLFRRKYANANPPNLDILLKEGFLRKKYKDPMTADGEFQLVFAAQQQQRPGSAPVSGAAGQITQPTTPPAPTPLDQTTQGPAGATGGIIGVVSKSTEASLKVFNGRSKYNEWMFTPQTVLGNRAAGAGAKPGAPGADRPGGNVPGGTPGTARPGMPNPLRPGMPNPLRPGMPRPPR